MQLSPEERRLRGMHRSVSLALVALAVSACAASPTPTPVGSDGGPGPTAPELASGTVSGHGMTISVTAAPAVVAAGQRIEVEAVVTNDGDQPLVLSGSGSGFVFFSVTRVEDGLTSGPPVMSGDCAPHVLPPGEPMVVPFFKAGGFSPDDPNADFLSAYFSEDALTLPSGSWHIMITTAATLGEGCTGEQVQLEISLPVTVSD